MFLKNCHFWAPTRMVLWVVPVNEDQAHRQLRKLLMKLVTEFGAGSELPSAGAPVFCKLIGKICGRIYGRTTSGVLQAADALVPL